MCIIYVDGTYLILSRFIFNKNLYVAKTNRRRKEGLIKLNRVLKLDCVLLDISSITIAEKAKRILKSNGIRSEIRRTGKGLDGCGYQLKIMGDTLKARALLSNSGVSVHGVSPCKRQ